jgi:hypothetical protein
MLKINEDKLVEFALQCKPGQPRTGSSWKVDRDGNPFILPGIGGISLNVQIGDSAFGWEADHLEPGVSCTSNEKKRFKHPNVSLQTFACAGNKAKIISGDAEGEEGYVVGHHGGSEHVIIEFPKKVKEKMTYDDKILVKGKGQGLKMLEYDDIKIFNLAPELLKNMDIKKIDDRKLQIPVTTKIPASCMGSGVGSPNVSKGDYDIMTSDPETVEEYNLDKIRFGDFVAILDHDNRYGRAYKKNAVTIGIVVHSDCKLSGHGPGVTTLITSDNTGSIIEPVIDSSANIKNYIN